MLRKRIYLFQYSSVPRESNLNDHHGNDNGLRGQRLCHGAPPTEFFAQVQTVTGQMDERMPPPLHSPNLESGEPIRLYELQVVGSRVLGMRKRLGDEAAIASINAWAEVPVPKFYKL